MILIESIRYLKTIEDISLELSIFGDGETEYLEQLNSCCRKYNIDDIVYFKGFEKDLKKIFYEKDLFIFPSLEQESLPMVVLEAMAHSIPVLATNVGGVDEIFDKYERKLLVPPQDHIKIAEGIKFFNNLSQDDRNLIKDKGIKLIDENFSIEIMGAKYYSLLS